MIRIPVQHGTSSTFRQFLTNLYIFPLLRILPLISICHNFSTTHLSILRHRPSVRLLIEGNSTLIAPRLSYLVLRALSDLMYIYGLRLLLAFFFFPSIMVAIVSFKILQNANILPAVLSSVTSLWFPGSTSYPFLNVCTSTPSSHLLDLLGAY